MTSSLYFLKQWRRFLDINVSNKIKWKEIKETEKGIHNHNHTNTNNKQKKFEVKISSTIGTATTTNFYIFHEMEI